MSKKKRTRAPNTSPDVDDAGSGWAAQVVPSRNELEGMISKITPRSETAGGMRYFRTILRKRGPEELIDTLAVFRRMLDEGGLDPNEMQKHQRDTIPTLPIDTLMDRGEFLRRLAWLGVGLSATAGSGLKGTSNGYGAMTPQDDVPEPHDGKQPAHTDGHKNGRERRQNHAGTAFNYYEKNILPYENLLVGAALIREGYDKWEGIKLRQIKDTVLRIPNKELEALEKKEDKTELRKELTEMISMHSVGGTNHDWVAQDFLLGLLDNPKVGEQAVIAFLTRASTALDKQSELDLEIDLASDKWPEERKQFDAIRLPAKLGKLSKSDFRETWGWIVPGHISMADGALRSHAIGLDPNGAFMKGFEKYVYNLISQPMLGNALTNSASIHWKEIKLKQIGDAVTDMNHHKIDWEFMQKKPLKLDIMIENLDNPEEKYAGIYFLKTLLKSKNGVDKAGVERVKNFLDRAKVIIGESSAQELPDHFTKEEKEIFDHYNCRPNLDLENSLETAGWRIPGDICRANGYATAADILISTVTGNKHNVAGNFQHFVHNTLGPIEGVTIGVTLVADGLKKLREHNIGQISDATAQLVDMTTQAGVQYR